MNVDRRWGKSTKKISPTVFSIFAVVLMLLILFSFSQLLYAEVMPLPILFIAALVTATLGAAFIYFVGEHWTKGSRTVREMILNRKINDVKKDALEWFEQNRFQILKANKNFIVATKGRGRFIPRICSELSLKEKNGKCLLHGEFYTKMKGEPERDLKEKILLGSRPRRQGFRLMNKLLDFIKKPRGESY